MQGRAKYIQPKKLPSVGIKSETSRALLWFFPDWANLALLIRLRAQEVPGSILLEVTSFAEFILLFHTQVFIANFIQLRKN